MTGTMRFGVESATPSQRTAALQRFVRPHSQTIVVKAGHSIQAAVDSASPGDTILVEPGTYHEKGRPCPFKPNEKCAVSITQDDITLVAESGQFPVVLDNPTGLSVGIGTGKDYECSQNSRITGNGRLHDSVAVGATDTGFYVGISQRIRVDHNVAYGNVSGYEFENTIGSLMDHNTAYDNTGGILEFIIPRDPHERSANNVIRDNVVIENNNANKCTNGVVCTVPPGTGILDIGGTNDRILNNRVTNNVQYGIALTDVCTAFGLTKKQCKALKYNPLAEKTRITGNTALYNQYDLAWSPQMGKGNCGARNRGKTTIPSKLPSC